MKSSQNGYAGTGGESQTAVQPHQSQATGLHQLPFTGYDVAPLLVVGIFLVLLGMYVRSKVNAARGHF